MTKTQNCDETFQDVVEFSRKDLIEIESMPIEERILKYNQLKQNRREYEQTCTKNLTFNEKANRLGYFDIALLRISYTLKDQGIAKDFTQDEYEAFSKLNQFINLDYVTPEEIATALFNKKGKIYDIVKKWYEEQMYEFEKMIDPEGKKVRQTLATALRHEYLLRFEKIKKGIIEYFNKDPGAPKELFSEYEDVIRKEYEAEMERIKIEENTRRIAEQKNAELERQIEELREEREKLDQYLSSYGAKGQDLQSKINAVISSLQNNLRQLLDEKRKLEQEKNNLLEMLNSAKNQTKAVIEAEIKRYEDTNKDLENKIAQLQNALSQMQLEKNALQEKIEDIKNASSSSIAIKFDEARIMEVNFIGRFETKINQPRKYFDPIRKEEFEMKKPSTVYKSEETAKLLIPPQDIPKYPHNTEITCIMRKNRILREDLEVIVKAKFLSHLENFTKTFYDNKTIGLSDILPYLDQAIEEARKGKVLYVIGIASPTGFSEELTKYVNSDDFYRNFTSYYVTMCLVNLLTGEIIYNKMDEKIKDYIDLFEPQLENEKIQKLKEEVKHYLLLDGYITLSKAIEKTNSSQILMKRVFYEIQKEGTAKIYEEKQDIILKVQS
ncbi:hypothetical protein [Acidianus manzaensis]|uniref:Uncharacterized protein n=1 Tax=Acidianus manzaensis TaxID=282676 RepID=A0A1W6K3F9_9CREN|nr:hypothetical protein [Acidianus manzaensis]ARM76974.1 hypothetical protein B6F84_13735 [Acidianus manzaensis]